MCARYTTPPHQGREEGRADLAPVVAEIRLPEPGMTRRGLQRCMSLKPQRPHSSRACPTPQIRFIEKWHEYRKEGKWTEWDGKKWYAEQLPKLPTDKDYKNWR